MEKEFDMKLMILKLRRLEDENTKLKKKFKVKDNDPIFKKDDPESIITIRKKNYWKKAKKGLSLTHVINTLKKEKKIKPE